MTDIIIDANQSRVNPKFCTPTVELSAVLINLLEFIFNHSKLYGYAWHSNAYIAEHTHCTERTITRRLKALADAGYIAIYYKHGERHIRPLRVYPVSTQCLTINTKPKGYTKENNYVSPNEILEEKTNIQADAPTLPNQSASEKANSRGIETTVETETAFEWVGLIEERVEEDYDSRTGSGMAPQSNNARYWVQRTAECTRQDTGAEGHLSSVDMAVERNGCATPRHRGGLDRVLSAEGDAVAQQEDDTPAPTEATNETTILSEKERRDNAHDGRTAVSAEIETGRIRTTRQNDREPAARIGADGGGLGKPMQRSANAETCTVGHRGRIHGSLETLTAHGVDTAQAQRIASQHTQEAIARAIAYANQQEARKGRLTNKAGFIVSALSDGWHFKLLDVSPEGIKKRAERLRVKANSGEATMTGAMPPMALLRAKLGGASA